MEPPRAEVAQVRPATALSVATTTAGQLTSPRPGNKDWTHVSLELRTLPRHYLKLSKSRLTCKLQLDSCGVNVSSILAGCFFLWFGKLRRYFFQLLLLASAFYIQSNCAAWILLISSSAFGVKIVKNKAQVPGGHTPNSSHGTTVMAQRKSPQNTVSLRLPSRPIQKPILQIAYTGGKIVLVCYFCYIISFSFNTLTIEVNSFSFSKLVSPTLSVCVWTLPMYWIIIFPT